MYKMPGGQKRKNKNSKNKKPKKNDKLTKNGSDKIEVGNIVEIDKENIIVVNNNEETKMKSPTSNRSAEIKTASIKKQSIGTIYEDVSIPKDTSFDTSLRSVDLNEAFLDSKNNNSSQTKNSYSNEEKNVSKKQICPVKGKSESDRKSLSDRNNYKTIEDFVAEGVPLHIAMMKHPLQHSWTYWYHGNNESLTWEQNHRQIVTVDTVEDFWQVFHYLEPASKIDTNCDYSLFKKGIFPDWEDFQNMPGGRWSVNSDRSNRGEGGQLDNWWMEILLILIGEQAEQYAGLVNGAVVNIKNKVDKLAIWLNDARDLGGVMEIGRLLKSRLGLGNSTKITFTVHSEDKRPRKGRFGSGGSPGKLSL